MHSSRMRTARLLTISHIIRLGGLPNPLPPRKTPPGSRLLPWKHTPPCGCRPPSPPVNRMTHRCKNITLAQTSFAGGILRLNTRNTPKFRQYHLGIRAIILDCLNLVRLEKRTWLKWVDFFATKLLIAKTEITTSLSAELNATRHNKNVERINTKAWRISDIF